MLRRAALALLLAMPIGALADSLSFTPTVLGKTDCGTTSDNLTIAWTVTVTGSTAFVVNSDKYRLLVSQSSGCPASDSTTAQLGSDQTATALTQSYLVNRADFLSAAQIVCGTAHAVYVCVTLYSSDAATTKGSVSGSIQYSLTAPPTPANVSVSPGDGALYVSWSAGTSTGSTVAVDHYEVTATAAPAADDTATDTAAHSAQSFKGTSGRYAGLVNGVTYQVRVVAVSAGGNASDPSAVTASATGRPETVLDFWAQYQAAGGPEAGGCAGGAAGGLSLLALAALTRILRRRS